jgi:redox-sensitive bicupin YhaK (pirin superfamily)
MASLTQKKLYVAPRATSLPPLLPTETVPQTGPRVVQPVLSLVKQPFGTILCGAHDIMGRGSNVNEVPHADPFTLVHFVETNNRLKPPFCAHPHCGAEVASIMLRGEEIVPWDNQNGNEKTKLLPGGIYYVSTGSGVVHDETQHLPFSTRKLSQAAFVPGNNGNVPEKIGSTLTQFFQVWWNGGYIYNNTLPKCRTQLTDPADVPLVVLPGGLGVRVLIGTLPVQETNSSTAESKLKSNHSPPSATSPIDQMGYTPILIMHCNIDPSGDAILKVPADMNGMLFITGNDSELIVQDEIHCSKNEISQQLVLLPPGGDTLSFKNPSSTIPCECVVFLGIPVRKPYCKYVGYGGAMVHQSKELCEEMMSSYEADPKHFGRADSSAPVDFSKFKLIKGFFNKNAGGLEREDDVLARFEWADDYVPPGEEAKV